MTNRQRKTHSTILCSTQMMEITQDHHTTHPESWWFMNPANRRMGARLVQEMMPLVMTTRIQNTMTSDDASVGRCSIAHSDPTGVPSLSPTLFPWETQPWSHTRMHEQPRLHDAKQSRRDPVNSDGLQHDL